MKRYVMIGQPVSAVRTPPLLERRLAALGAEAQVLTRELAPDALDRFARETAADRSIDGLLVTMPHKRALARRLDALSSTARRVGSVNAVKRLASGALAGAQFDGVALVNALDAANVRLTECRVLLLGVGGAGLAIAEAFAARGCQRLVLADLDGARASRARERLRSPLIETVAAARLGEAGDHDLLVNATPMGMSESDPPPFSERQVRRAACVADIVADPPRTRLAALARRAGTKLVSGRDMVRGQIDPIARWLLHAGLEQDDA